LKDPSGSDALLKKLKVHLRLRVTGLTASQKT